MVAVEDIKATHQDRPTAKVEPPFRVFNGRFPYIEYDQIVDRLDHTKVKVPMQVPIEESGYGNQIGLKVRELMTLYYEVVSKVDGMQAAVDQLTTELLMKDREIEKLTNQLSEARRSNGKKGTTHA
jgi:hypothetical protein